MLGHFGALLFSLAWTGDAQATLCTTHAQCGANKYCFSCAACRSNPSCSPTWTCDRFPTLASCGDLPRCEIEMNAVNGVCPTGDSACATVICPFPQQCVSDATTQYKCEKPPPSACDWVQCPSGQICVNTPQQCVTTPCEQYSCVSNTVNPCAGVVCPASQQCVPEPKQCFTAPCPQYRCQAAASACTPTSCPAGRVCVPEPKACVTTPCNQFRCDVAPTPSSVPSNPCQGVICSPGLVCSPDPKQCITTPCNQFKCESPCSPNPCALGYQCVPLISTGCVSPPCQQYKCVAPTCGVNEEYTYCGSSSCWENTCSNIFGSWPPAACTADCRSGCRCISGYKRNTRNQCVVPTAC